jgi:hypothetical protein
MESRAEHIFQAWEKQPPTFSKPWKKHLFRFPILGRVKRKGAQ